MLDGLQGKFIVCSLYEYANKEGPKQQYLDGDNRWPE